jgi:hypothetical protein
MKPGPAATSLAQAGGLSNYAFPIDIHVSTFNYATFHCSSNDQTGDLL